MSRRCSVRSSQASLTPVGVSGRGDVPPNTYRPLEDVYTDHLTSWVRRGGTRQSFEDRWPALLNGHLKTLRGAAHA